MSQGGRNIDTLNLSMNSIKELAEAKKPCYDQVWEYIRQRANSSALQITKACNNCTTAMLAHSKCKHPGQ